MLIVCTICVILLYSLISKSNMMNLIKTHEMNKQTSGRIHHLKAQYLQIKLQYSKILMRNTQGRKLLQKSISGNYIRP